MRRAADNISGTHDLTKMQREELQGLIKEARKKKRVISHETTCTWSQDHYGTGS